MECRPLSCYVYSPQTNEHIPIPSSIYMICMFVGQAVRTSCPLLRKQTSADAREPRWTHAAGFHTTAPPQTRTRSTGLRSKAPLPSICRQSPTRCIGARSMRLGVGHTGCQPVARCTRRTPLSLFGADITVVDAIPYDRRLLYPKRLSSAIHGPTSAKARKLRFHVRR